MSVFGEELRRLRLRSGLSQEILATRAGLSTEAVSLLERGRRTPRMTTLGLLASAMGLAEPDRAAFFATATSQEPFNHVLPTFSDRLLGRDDELSALAITLSAPEVRLVSLVGPPGAGKTRLALAYAEAHQSDYPDGVRWLPIGSLGGGGSMVPAVVAALGIQGAVRAGPVRLTELLQDKIMLLLIDNAEHQPDECVSLIGVLLEVANAIKIVVISRHELDMPAAQRRVIAPLELPPVGTTGPRLSNYSASQLFLARSRLSDQVSDADAEAITRICHRLNGLPLALELASARTTVLTVRELADTLDGEWDIPSADEPTDGTTLAEAMIEWSYELLAPYEKLIFDRLAVFSGGFNRDAVTSICGDGLTGIEVLEILSALVSKSLVARRDSGNTQARFRLLHLVRQYARARFSEHADQETIHRRHADYYGNLVDHADHVLLGQDQSTWLTTLDNEVDNISAAIGWTSREVPEMALRLTAGMRRWCYLRGRYSQGRTWAAMALEAAPNASARLRAPVLHAAATLAFLQCDHVDAEALTLRARKLFSAIGDDIGVLESISRLGAIARQRGEYDLARSLHQQALQMADDLGDDHQAAHQTNYLSLLSWTRGDADEAIEYAREAFAQMQDHEDREGTIWSLLNLGAAARLRGDLEAAGLLLAQCQEVCDELAFREGSAWTANQLGVVARLNGDLGRAAELQQASLNEHRQLGNRWREASSLDELAAIAVAQNEPLEAAQLIGMADRLRAQIGAPVPAGELADREQTVRATRDALGAAYEVLTGHPAP